MVRLYGWSAACAAEAHEECEEPNRCDCDCHLDDPQDDGFPMYDQDFPGGW